MTAPREIVPGRIWFVTRRCTQRQFLLRPDDETNQIFSYCLAAAAARYSIGLIAWLAMSNHYHAVVYDPLGELPAFLEHFHKLLAKSLNARWGRWENFWASEETCAVHLVAPADVLEKVVYTLTNPINDNLVDSAVQWPGCSSIGYLGRRSSSHARPRFYFSRTGTMLLNVHLEATPPPGVETEVWAAQVRAAIAVVERNARAARHKDGRRLLGRQPVLSQSPFDTPSHQHHGGTFAPL